MASTASKGVVTSRTIPSNKAAPPPLPTPVLGGRSNNTRKELPLREYMPSSYICFLEGSLLSNGDLKGLWRLQRGDTLANEFLMVLMDRGVYEGGFHCTINLQQAVDGGFITQEIRDDWFGVDWCATTEHTSNIWGRGGNVSFGKYYLLGSHDATTGEAILYKVDEAEVRRAKAHCVSQRPPTCLSTTPLQWQQQQQQQQQQQRQQHHQQQREQRLQPASCSSNNNSKSSNLGCNYSTSPARESTAQTKRPRPWTSTPLDGGGEGVVEVATALVQTEPSSASVRPISGSPVHEKDRVYPPGHPANNSMGAERVPAVRIKGAIASSWIESGNESASDSDSDSSSDVVVRRRDGSVVLAADMSEVSASPASKAKKENPQVLRGALPGFSCWGNESDDDDDDEGNCSRKQHVDGVQDTQEQQDSMADLTAHAAKLQREKVEITENFRVLHDSLGNAKTEIERRIGNAEREEKSMVDALAEVRWRLSRDQRELRRLHAGIQTFQEKEGRLLVAWKDKWAVEVEPLIAEREKEVARKTEEMVKKTKSAEDEKQALQQRVAQLRSVKNMFAAGVSADTGTGL